MTARIIDGKIIATELRARVAEVVARIKQIAVDGDPKKLGEGLRNLTASKE